MRVFLDTNVIASATATRGLYADVFRFTTEFHELVISEHLLIEPSAPSKISQGVTAEIVGNCGASAAPRTAYPLEPGATAATSASTFHPQPFTLNLTPPTTARSVRRVVPVRSGPTQESSP